MPKRYFLAMVCVLFALSGCELDDAIDCHDICTDFDECLGDEIDVSECVDHCQAEPEDQIEGCDACLDSEGMSCFDCSLECIELAF